MILFQLGYSYNGNDRILSSVRDPVYSLRLTVSENGTLRTTQREFCTSALRAPKYLAVVGLHLHEYYVNL